MANLVVFLDDLPHSDCFRQLKSPLLSDCGRFCKQVIMSADSSCMMNAAGIQHPRINGITTIANSRRTAFGMDGIVAGASSGKSKKTAAALLRWLFKGKNSK